MPKAVSESASEWVAFADLQSANNNDPDDEDAVVDDSPGLPDGDDDDISTMSVESSPAEEDDAPEQEDDALAAASAHQHTAGHVPPHLPTATGEDNNAFNEPPPLPTAAEEPPPLPTATEDEPSPPVPKGRNPHCHHLLGQGKCVLLSLDVETGGEYCGILQLSAEICRLTIQTSGRSSTKDTAAAILRDANTFNAYVRPADGAIFSEACTNIHGLTADSPCIQHASDIDVVWSQFVNWINTSTARDERIIIVAYNGEKCDMKWLWKLTQAPFTHLNLPTRIKYFMDPYKVMNHYKTCRLNKRFTKLDSYELGVMWRYIQLPEIKNLNGAHNSLVDTKAQTDLFTHPEFVPFINRAASIQPVDKIFSSTQLSVWMKRMEPVRTVHEPWQEVTRDADITWQPDKQDRYTGPEGGGKPGPSQKMIAVARKGTSLSAIFLAIVPLTFFVRVAELSEKYCYKDWVVEKERDDRDGNRMKTKYFQACPAKTNGKPTPGRRHRADNETKKYTITPGFVLCWFGILILNGAHFGDRKRDSRKLWRKPPHGISLPYVQNMMSRNAYEFLRRHIHFADDSKRKKKGLRGYDPLFKVRYVLVLFMKGIMLAWIAGQLVTIDESMIKYMGRGVSYVQYMPVKPIKHGIKVFVLCCAYSAVVLSMEVYVGKEDEIAGDALSVCDRLMSAASINFQRGRTLFTDNYYTSVKLARHLFENYGWSVVGTITPTDKKSRQDEDFPFLKLSNGARLGVKRGWFREAVLQRVTATGKNIIFRLQLGEIRSRFVFYLPTASVAVMD